MEKIKPEYVILAILGILLFISPKEKIDVIKGNWDISEEVAAKGYEQYLVEEPDFDYSDEDVYALATEIKLRTSTPEEAVKETIRWVAKNIRYSSHITVDYCYNEKASTVLDSKLGDCVSMSRLVVSLLRAQGIPARTMGGCLSSGIRCSPLFAMVPLQEAQVTEMSYGDFKKRGFLHEYVEVWYGEDWKILEATSGQSYNFACDQYLDYGYDHDKYSRCTINSLEFFENCKVY